MLQVNGRAIFQKERADKELSGEPATELAQCLGNWMLSMEPRKLLQPGCDNGRGWEARVHARSLGDSGVIIGCDLEAEPGLQKIGKEGAKSRKGNRPFALLDTISG
jgi:hypothetical protein